MSEYLPDFIEKHEIEPRFQFSHSSSYKNEMICLYNQCAKRFLNPFWMVGKQERFVDSVIGFGLVNVAIIGVLHSTGCSPK